jgi:undecaprenyl-diphosphatase
VSRSGTTISAALFRRTRADVAAKFSFLLSIPAIAGAVAVEAGPILRLAPSMSGPLLAGVVVAGVTGLAAIAVLLRAIRAGRLTFFAYYCWVLGAVVLAGALFGGSH